MSCFNPLAEGNLKEGELIQQTQQLDLGVSQSVDPPSPSITLHHQSVLLLRLQPVAGSLQQRALLISSSEEKRRWPVGVEALFPHLSPGDRQNFRLPW